MAEKFREKVQCKKCGQPTWHTVLYKIVNSGTNIDAGFDYQQVYYFLQCNGCDNPCFLDEFSSTDDYNPETNEIEPIVEIFPNPFTHHKGLAESYHAPDKVRNAYKETLTAINLYNIPLLTAIGIRMTLEAICVQLEIKGKLVKQINSLIERKIITESQSDLLHMVRVAGNGSAHAMKKMSMEELKLCLEIVENVISSQWIQPEQVRWLKDKSL